MNQILLVAGSPRTGTTFIASRLNAHPQICLFSEFSLTDTFRSLDQMVGYAQSVKPDPSDASSVFSFIKPSSNDYDGLFRCIFRHVYPGKSPTILGTKMPALATKEDVDYLLSRHSRMKIIYILRNCKSTIASSMRRYEATLRGTDNWLYKNEVQALREWIYSLLMAQYLSNRADTLYLKYEEFIDDTNELARIGKFLDIKGLRFDVSPSLQRPVSVDAALATYPQELSTLVHRWDSLSADEIARYPLDAVRDHVAASWQYMGIAVCDIGTHVNFNRPEPWGAWSGPGFFALKPRFIRKSQALRYVDLEIRETRARVDRANIRAFIDHQATGWSVVGEFEGGTRLRIARPRSRSSGGERPLVSLFFDRWIVSERDPRPLGLPVNRYRLVWQEGDG